MTYRRHLAKTELVAVSALLAVAIAFAGYSAFQATSSANEIFSPAGAALSVFAYALMVGIFPVIAYGAPLYAALLNRGKASFLAALAIGIAPGFLLLLVATDLGTWSMICGSVVALITHAICRSGSNNLFKPKPLRGSA